MSHLLDLTVIEDHNALVIDDGTDTVGDGDDGRVELADRLLDLCVGLYVETSGGFIHDEDVGRGEERAGEGDERFFADREVGATFVDDRIELSFHGRDFVLQVTRFEDGPEVGVIVNVARIQARQKSQ